MLRQTKVKNGEVRGLPGSNPRITVYKGIPFAAPPVGKNRWRAPQPAADWDGVLKAYEFGPISVQDTPGLGTDIYCRDWHVDPEIPMGEDCLYLNVWTPAKSKDEKLPVLVWYFGGGYQWGYTAEMEFDGEHLASRGIIVVSVNYRLGVFGYLAHPELTAESPEAPSNFGLLDQKAGLHWVYENIAAFGGDPDRISIAGQSAGGGSVMQQMTHADNFDIIKGAIVMSGMMRPKTDSDIFKPINLEKAEAKGKDFFEFCGLKSLEEARNADPIVLRDKYAEYARDHERIFPICDGKFCVGDPMDRFVKGECADIPVIAGNTSDEFLMKGESIVEQSVKSAFLDVQTVKPSKPCYYYRFDPDIPGWDHPGTFHSVDLWFWFESLGKCWRPFTGHHFDLARDMADYLANFVKTGDPNGPSTGNERKLPVWETYTKDHKSEMILDSRGAVPGKEGGLRLGNTGVKQAVNPYLPSWEYVPDGEPYVFNNRVYVYGSHDLYDGETFCLGDYVCWSAPVDDLGNWHYEGVIYEKTADPFNKDGHMCLYAPDVTVGPDGRYYLFYVLDKVNVVSVAVSDKPAGPYSFYGYVHYEDGTRLGDKEGDEPQFDPGVLTEGDKTYLYTGFAGHGDKSRHGAMFTVLGPDMLTIVRAPEFVAPGDQYSAGTCFEGHAFFEAPSIRKKGGKYYFIYSSEVMHELCYATSDKPEGPFVYGGVLQSNCDKGIDSYKPADMAMAYGGNNHGSMVQIGDDWYIFYHRQTNGNWFSRQVCAEKLSFNADGSIRQAELTSCGLNGKPLQDIGEYPTYIACNIFTDKHSTYVEGGAPIIVMQGGDGDKNIGYIKQLSDKSTAGFKYFEFKEATGLKIKTRGYFNGKYEARLTWDGPVIGEAPIDGTNVWTDRVCRFDKPVNGVHALYFTFVGSGTASMLSFEILHD